ncbi:hypothetical protein [Enterobacteriaceae endosymbiont of Macroplea appendiculata]|uniref:hypothetical protein n=1 Tax=Enterobacteriaceae endosymbiont of Macroplea appendiculata TaxID=2675790 RepID=UPI0014494295|nr:hypothetical protein [Enterobacteriaceae endosymbiont of Macroplea appendiculata]QJC30801.1 hypothetical protein GJT86_00915 [Enterobacteriaceae endosymbiont of Macroplea appendiculata]
MKTTLKFIPLNHWILIIVNGKDSKKFLQHQLTINIDNLTDQKNFLYACHCNSKGRLLTNMKIFKYKHNCYGYIIRKNIAQIYLNSIKKYMFLYDVHILCSTKSLVGIYADNNTTQNFLLHVFQNSNYLMHKHSLLIDKDNILLKIRTMSRNKYLTIIIVNNIHNIISYIRYHKIAFSYNYDIKLFCQIGYPIIDKNNFTKFIPQEINMYKFHAIDLHKGCYIGQEIINKIYMANNHYNNNKLFSIKIKITNIIPRISDRLIITSQHTLTNKHYIINGYILTIYYFTNNQYCLMQIMSKIAITYNINIKILREHKSYSLYIQK